MEAAETHTIALFEFKDFSKLPYCILFHLLIELFRRNFVMKHFLGKEFEQNSISYAQKHFSTVPRDRALRSGAEIVICYCMLRVVPGRFCNSEAVKESLN